MIFKAKSLGHLIIHVLIIAALFFGLLASFFYFYLPSATKHGESITVPKLTGMTVEELEEFLSSRNLRYQINDSTYVSGVKPHTVLSQHPLEGSKVKDGRKIYISVSAVNPPKVKMPNLIDLSLKSAEMMLKGYDLVLAGTQYVPSPYSNVVIDQLVEGKHIEHGTPVAKGTKVTLLIGNGTGTEEKEVPELIGMPLDEARVLLAGIGLTISEKSDPESPEPDGTVTRQKPAAGEKLKSGEIVDVWVAGQPTTFTR
jgi:beta-lactam-binding protein with PASTA domain